MEDQKLIEEFYTLLRSYQPDPLFGYIDATKAKMLADENRRRHWVGMNFPLKESVWRWYDAQAWEDCCIVAYLASGWSKSMKRNPKW